LVRRVAELTPRLRRVTFGGPELDGLVIDQPAASVRLLLPLAATGELVMPEWTGNLFLLPDGGRAPIRTFTPRRLDAASSEIDIDIVIHGQGAASEWAAGAREGDRGAISGPARGYVIDEAAPAFLLAGDETAIPAISQLLEQLPTEAEVDVQIEAGAPSARLALPAHPRATVTWHDLLAGASPGDALAKAVVGAGLDGEVRVWVAGEAAAVQRIRKHLFTERGMARTQATVRGYWKHGRAADAGAGDSDGED
jgi:NADPH-dependent ferric siderophore reductase